MISVTAPPLHTKEDLLSFFQNGEKKEGPLKVGTEHEVFLFDQKTGHRARASQISKLLEDWGQKKGGSVLYEQNHAIGLQMESASLSLEPGGQFELSGAPLTTLHETAQEISDYQATLDSLTSQHGLFPLAMGADPITSLSDRDWMTKERYQIMRPYMLTRGSHGHEMMTGTCTVQANLDYTSEKNMVRKMRIGVALQPFVTALFAHSGLSLGRSNGYQSRRRFFWNHTDPDRCGFLSFVFEESMGYERYLDYALSVPMYSVRRGGKTLNVAGTPFRDFLEGKLDILPGEKPTMEDWSDHLTTLFPEVRLKQYLEMRGADSAPFPYLLALPSFWVGLLYSSSVLSDVESLIREWPLKDIQIFSDSVDRQGFHASFLGRPILEWLQDILALSQRGLRERQRGEEPYLAPLFDLVRGGKSLSDLCLEFLKGGETTEDLIKTYRLQHSPFFQTP